MSHDKGFDAEHIELWRGEIARAEPVPLGAFNWPLMFGLALDEIERQRKQTTESADPPTLC